MSHARRCLLLCLGLLLVLVLQLRPLDDLDLFWQVRTGQLMLEHGTLATRDTFTYTVDGAAVPPLAWLAQLGYAALYRLGSWPAVQLVHALSFAGAFVIVSLALDGQAVRPFSLVAAVALGFLTALPHGSVRPQGFAALGFAVLLAGASRERLGWPGVLALAPVLLFWQNAHPSVVVGAVGLVPVTGEAWLNAWRGRGPRPWPLTALIGLAALSQLATPLGWGIVAMQRQNLQVSRDWLGISEWLPPWHPTVRGALLPFWVGLGLSLLLLIRLRFRVRPAELGLFLVFTALTLTAARFALFWALALVPVWSRWLDRAAPADLFAWRDEAAPPRAARTLLSVAGVEAVLVALLFVRGPTFPLEVPLAGVEALQQVLPMGRVYNYREWGGPLIFAGAPAWRVAIDGRVYLFDRETWNDYHATARGTVPLAEVERRHRPDAFFLRPGFHEPFLPQLRQSAAWQEVHADAACVVFVKRSR